MNARLNGVKVDREANKTKTKNLDIQCFQVSKVLHIVAVIRKAVLPLHFRCEDCERAACLRLSIEIIA